MPSPQFIGYQINQNTVYLDEIDQKVAGVNSNVESVKQKIDTDLPTRASQASVNIISSVVDTILTKVDTEVQAILDRVNLLSTQATQNIIDNNVDTLVARLTSTRAGYLDYIANSLPRIFDMTPYFVRGTNGQATDQTVSGKGVLVGLNYTDTSSMGSVELYLDGSSTPFEVFPFQGSMTLFLPFKTSLRFKWMASSRAGGLTLIYYKY